MHASLPARAVARESLTGLTHCLPPSSIGSVQTILRSVRSHLGMDVAFVSQFVGRKRYFRHVDAGCEPAPLKPGDSMPLDEGYCLRVVEGSLPELIPDTSLVPAALAIPATREVPIGSHVSVPIRLTDGHLYGTFCCFSHEADPTLNQRDLMFMRAFADVAAFQIEHGLAANARANERLARIDRALALDLPAMLFQPKVAMDDKRVVGLECLARFDMEPVRGPADWFKEANEAGRAPLLEMQAMRNAVRAIATIDVPSSIQVCLNTSARTLVEHDVLACIGDFPCDRIVLELTEHDYVADYAALVRALRPLRERGVRIAIDDAGAGYSSMSHILNINPDYIKLDISITRNVDHDHKRRALAAALIEFGRQIECKVVAEGVETAPEFDALRRLGVDFAQGFFISPPVPLDRVEALIGSLGH